MQRKRERERASMLIEHRAHSARAKCSRRGSVLHIDYSGVLSAASISDLERRVLPDRRGAWASFERMDNAVMALSGPVIICPENYPAWVPPSAVIVPPSMYERSMAFCHRLAALGVLRVPFLPDEIETALLWVGCFSGHRTQLPV